MKNDALSLVVALIFFVFSAGLVHAAASSEFRSRHCINIAACLSVDRTAAIDMPVADGLNRQRDHHGMAMSGARRSMRSGASVDASSDPDRIVRDQSVKPVIRLILRSAWEPPTPNASSRRSAPIQPIS